MSISNILEKITGLLYPGRCPVCDGVLVKASPRICPECRGKLVYVKEPKCVRCGRQLSDDEQECCEACTGRKVYFHKGLTLFLYNDVIRKSIYRFKYANRREYSEFYSDEICRHFGRQIQEFQADALLPVPLHRKRRRMRGYNQAELLAAGIGKRTGIPVRSKILVRQRNTKPLKSMTRTERENNLKRAFKIRENDVELNTVIVVDDILTTGSTINEISAVLRENGIEKVYFVALASGAGI